MSPWIALCALPIKKSALCGLFYWHLGEVDENSRGSEFDKEDKADGSMPVSIADIRRSGEAKAQPILLPLPLKIKALKSVFFAPLRKAMLFYLCEQLTFAAVVSP